MRHSSRTTVRQLAEYRARICLMGLKELRCSWDANNWILQLFYECLDDETAKTLEISDLKRGRSLAKEATRLSRSTPTYSAWGSTRESAQPATGTAQDTGDRTDRDNSVPLEDANTLVDCNPEGNLDFMSQLLNLRDADDAFFDGTMDSDFTNAEMNLDGIFDQTSPLGISVFKA